MNFNRVGEVGRGVGAHALDKLLSCNAHAAVELMYLLRYKVYAGICGFKRVSVSDDDCLYYYSSSYMTCIRY